MIKIPFTLRKTKIISKVNLLNNEHKNKDFDLIIDCGCSMTTISPQLYKRLGSPIKDKAHINVIGINSCERSFSVLLPSFRIGGEDLGEVRVAVGHMRPEFQNSVLLGMNILGWFDFGWTMFTKTAILRPRQFKNPNFINNCFKLKNPSSKLLVIDTEEISYEDDGEMFSPSESFT